MKKVILISLMLILSLYSKAQDTTRSKWAIGVAIAPVYTIFTLSPFSKFQEYKISHKTTISDGINIKYTISKKIDFDFGLFYDRLYYNVSSNSHGTFYAAEYWNTLATVPFQLDFKFGHNKLSYAVSPGFSINVADRLMYFGTISATVKYKLSNKFSMYLQPEYCQGLTNLKPNIPNYVQVISGFYNNYMEYFKTNFGFYYSLENKDQKMSNHSSINTSKDTAINIQKSNETTNSDLAIGASIAPVYAFHSYYWSLPKSSSITLGYALNAKYKAAKSADISFGFSYDKLSYNSGNDYFSNTFNYSLLSFPAKFIFKFENENFYVGISPGISPSILQTNQVLTTDIGSNYVFNSSLYKDGAVLLFYNVSAYLNFKISNKIYLSFQPEFIHALTPLVYRDNGPEEYNFLSYFKTSIGFYYSL